MHSNNFILVLFGKIDNLTFVVLTTVLYCPYFTWVCHSEK